MIIITKELSASHDCNTSYLVIKRQMVWNKLKTTYYTHAIKCAYFGDIWHQYHVLDYSCLCPQYFTGMGFLMTFMWSRTVLFKQMREYFAKHATMLHFLQFFVIPSKNMTRWWHFLAQSDKFIFLHMQIRIADRQTTRFTLVRIYLLFTGFVREKTGSKYLH